jgi:hypothetical protein
VRFVGRGALCALGLVSLAACDVMVGLTPEENANKACNEIARSVGGIDEPLPSRDEAEPHIERALQYARDAGGQYADFRRMIERYERSWKARDLDRLWAAAIDVHDFCFDLQVGDLSPAEILKELEKRQ